MELVITFLLFTPISSNKAKNNEQKYLVQKCIYYSIPPPFINLLGHLQKVVFISNVVFLKMTDKAVKFRRS